MNAHICRCVPNIIVMRTLKTRSTCLPTKKNFRWSEDRGDTQGRRCATVIARRTPLALLAVTCRSLPLQCSKKAALACLTGASAPGTPCAMISSLPISTFCAAVSGTRSLTCLNPRLLRDKLFTAVQCLSFPFMFHPAPSQSIVRSGAIGQACMNFAPLRPESKKKSCSTPMRSVLTTSHIHPSISQE